MTAASVPSLQRRRRRSPHSPFPPPPTPPPSRQHTDICIFMSEEPQCEGRSVSAFCFSPSAVDAPAMLESSRRSAPVRFLWGSFFFSIHFKLRLQDFFSRWIYITRPSFEEPRENIFTPLKCKAGHWKAGSGSPSPDQSQSVSTIRLLPVEREEFS